MTALPDGSRGRSSVGPHMRPALLTAALAAALLVPATADARAPGAVVSAKPLRHGLWIPGTTSHAYKLKYATTDARGRRALSTGMVFLPKGKAPRGGWPVISWAHGTSGLGDSCAPSVVGPALPKRDRPYLANWMKEGYAIVASDYAGLGTPGPARVPQRALGGSQHRRHRQGGARSYTGKLVAASGSSSASRREAARRSTPPATRRSTADAGSTTAGPSARARRPTSRTWRSPSGPGFLELSAGVNSYMAYIFASLRRIYPELGIAGILTASGRKYLDLAEKECVNDFEPQLEGVDAGRFFTRPVADLPKLRQTLIRYMKMPESGLRQAVLHGPRQQGPGRALRPDQAVRREAARPTTSR